MACSGSYRSYMTLSTQYVKGLEDCLDTLKAIGVFEAEEKARQMFAWKEPKKRITVPTVSITRRYEKMAMGRKFPVGGPKK